MKREDLYMRSHLDSDGLVDFIDELGGNSQVLMTQAGLKTEPRKGKIQFVSWNAMCRLFELAAEALDDPYFGLKWAKAQPKDYRNSGPTLFLGSIASNIRNFADLAIDYQKIHTNGVSYRYEETHECPEASFIVSIHPISVPCRQFCEQIIGTIAIMRQRYISEFTFNRVTFQHSAPEDLTMYQDIFQCPVVFNADVNSIIFDKAFLDLKRSKLTTKLIAPFIKEYFNWKVKRHPYIKHSTEHMVAEILPTILGVKNSDIASVADIMDLHPKKLQRLLKDEGTTYKDILDDVRKGISERLLSESNISIERLAKMLDYSSGRPFTKAAKRWFDMTPTQYRQKSRRRVGD